MARVCELPKKNIKIQKSRVMMEKHVRGRVGRTGAAWAFNAVYMQICLYIYEWKSDIEVRPLPGNKRGRTTKTRLAYKLM